jgi:peptide/nickel transport system permease protein
MNVELTRVERVRRSIVVRGSLGTRLGRSGLALIGVVVLIALVGPLFSSYGPIDTQGLPFDASSAAHPLGLDTLGRDVLSRFLYGGRTLIAVATVATVLAYVVGIPLGMAAGYRRGILDYATLGVTDLVFSFPPIIFVLVLLSAVGPQLSMIIVGIATIHAPRIVRISRSVTLDIATQEFVEAAVARGESIRSILRHDILPNIWTPILADFGLRLTGSLILFSSLSYLGLGQAPPAPDWGLMISENRAGLLLQPWVIIVPAVTIAVLAIGVNLVADAVARSAGRSVVGRDV